MNELTAHCGCGRKMTPDSLRGRGAYRCGCGARLRLEMAAQRVSSCVVIENGSSCRFPHVTADPVALCKQHLRAFRKQLFAGELTMLPLCAEDADQLTAAWLDSSTEGGIDRDAFLAARAEARQEDAQQALQVGESSSVVYYLQFADRIKIGTTTNLRNRMLGVPHDRLLATERGGYILERLRHLQFADLRVTGEWFWAKAPLLDHIRQLPEHHVKVGRKNARFVLPPPDLGGVIYVSTKTAAALIGVTPPTISRWRRIGYLPLAAISQPRKPLYAWPDVINAAEQARQAAIETSGTEAQVRRHRAVCPA